MEVSFSHGRLLHVVYCSAAGFPGLDLEAPEGTELAGDGTIGGTGEQLGERDVDPAECRRHGRRGRV